MHPRDIDHGGSAFPGPSYTKNGFVSGHDMGLTVRDWFASQALAGWLASYTADDEVMPDRCAELSYKLADAMLAARIEGAK